MATEYDPKPGQTWKGDGASGKARHVLIVVPDENGTMIVKWYRVGAT